MRILLNPFVHFFFMALMYVGMRDRLRCPKCKAVGTWKPHGGILAMKQARTVRRWMCKYCGFYLGPVEDGDVVYPDVAKGYWDIGKGLTPKQAVEAALGKTWPWRG